MLRPASIPCRCWNWEQNGLTAIAISLPYGKAIAHGDFEYLTSFLVDRNPRKVYIVDNYLQPPDDREVKFVESEDQGDPLTENQVGPVDWYTRIKGDIRAGFDGYLDTYGENLWLVYGDRWREEVENFPGVDCKYPPVEIIKHIPAY